MPNSRVAFGAPLNEDFQPRGIIRAPAFDRYAEIGITVNQPCSARSHPPVGSTRPTNRESSHTSTRGALDLQAVSGASASEAESMISAPTKWPSFPMEKNRQVDMGYNPQQGRGNECSYLPTL
jgi:hypothetical protein